MTGAGNPKFRSVDSLVRTISARRDKRQQIVFTNGCFDVLHVGHVRYLREARQLGDLLIVALNTDDSVKKLKGRNRPIHTLADRAEILAALPFVTFVCAFDTLSVEPLIRLIKPDVLVKGGDYTANKVVGARYVRSYGGRVVVLEYAERRSSSRSIRKMRRTK